jgi:hypothetical protein
MCGVDIQNGETAATVGALATPALLLDKDRLDRNLARLSSRMAARAVQCRLRRERRNRSSMAADARLVGSQTEMDCRDLRTPCIH